MSFVQTSADAGVLGRVLSRLQDETPKIDARMVERALAAKQAAATSRCRTEPLAARGPVDGSTARTVSGAVSGRGEAIAVEGRWPYPGLAPMTRVRTSFGDVYAQALRTGDLVRTRSGKFKPIVWLDRILLDDEFLQTMDDSNPILLPEGSVARGLPKQDILVSPRQVIAAQGDFREPSEAGALLARRNIRRKLETGMSYTVFHLGRTEDVWCEGLWLRIDV